MNIVPHFVTYTLLISCQILGLTRGPSGTTAKFLNKAMDPPHHLAVQNAIDLLVDIGAFDQGVFFLFRIVFLVHST